MDSYMNAKTKNSWDNYKGFTSDVPQEISSLISPDNKLTNKSITNKSITN